MGLPVLDGKEEQGERVSSGTGVQAAERLFEATECGRLLGAGGSGSLTPLACAVGNLLQQCGKRSTRRTHRA
jgi:hypothetical protein